MVPAYKTCGVTKTQTGREVGTSAVLEEIICLKKEQRVPMNVWLGQANLVWGLSQGFRLDRNTNNRTLALKAAPKAGLKPKQIPHGQALVSDPGPCRAFPTR